MAKTKKSRHPFVWFYILFVLVVALAAAWFYLPIDSYVARHDAERKGYTVVSEPEELDYKYYYNRLNPTEQEAYNLIVSQVTDFPERIAVPNLTSEEVERVYTAISYDNPELFFLGNACQYMRFGAVFYFEPSYKLTAAEYAEQWAAVQQAADALLSEVPADASDYTKELFVHDRLGELCDYATDEDTVYTPYGLLVLKQANCEGYSRTAQYLLKRLGVVSRVISGVGTTNTGNENHMWNIVTISGQEYNMDVTWDDYIIDSGSGITSDEPSHVFFNAPTSDMRADHQADDDANWEGCVYSDLSYFEWNGLLCDSYEKASTAITRNLPGILNDGKTTLELKFTTDEAYERAKVQLISNDRIYYLISSANVLTKPGNKISSEKVQYSTDPTHLTLRFFFLK